MTIGTSDGNTYKTEFDMVRDSFSKPIMGSGMPLGASTELADDLKPDGAPIPMDNYRVRSQDPSTDSFDERYGDWFGARDPLHLEIQKTLQQEKEQNRGSDILIPGRKYQDPSGMGRDMRRVGNDIPTLPMVPSAPITSPQSPTGNWWIRDPSGKPIDRMPPLRNYPDAYGKRISDAFPDPVTAGQQYAADFSGRGSDLNGPYMHQQPYNETHRQNLLERAPVAKGGTPEFNEGDEASRRGSIREMLDRTQEEHDKNFENFKNDWEQLVKEGKAKPLNKNEKPFEAGIFRIRKDVKGIQEFLKDLPDDVEAFDMNDGTVVLKKKAALTS